MATNKKIDPSVIVLLLLISAGLGYAAYVFAQKQALASTATKTTNIVNTVVNEINAQVTQWQTRASSTADVPSKAFFRSNIAIENNNITNIDNYSFGEQALLTKAQTTDGAVSDFVVASEDVPKHILGTQKYVYATAVKINANQIMLTRVAIQPLASILTTAAVDNIGISLSSVAQSKTALLKAGTHFENKGHSQPLDVATDWQVNSSYSIASGVLSPKVLGLLAAGIVFLLGLIPILLLGIKRAKAAQALALEEQRKQAKRKSKASLKTNLVKTEGLPLEALPESENTDNTSTSSIDNAKPTTDEFTDNTAPASEPHQANENINNAPAFDTVASVNGGESSHDISPMLDDDLSFADLESEIKSDEAEIAKYRNEAKADDAQNATPETADNNQTMEFTSASSAAGTVAASQVIDPKGQLAADELDDGNMIDFAVPDISFTDNKVVPDSTNTVASNATSASGNAFENDAFENNAPENNSPKSDASKNNASENNTPANTIDTRFRVHDVRANAALLDANFIKRFAFGYKTMLAEAEQTAVIVGRDVRVSSESIADILIAALTNLGVSVTDIGAVTTPMLAFACSQAHGNGIMVTASHCGAQDNGFKWYIKQLSPEPAQVIALAQVASTATDEQIAAIASTANHERLQQSSVAETYQDAIAQDIMLADLPTVCIDCMHGAAGMLAPSIIENAGTVAFPYHFNVDGNFSTGNPDPTEAGRLAFLSQKVLENHADIGFAFDGDGDRLAVVDDKGRAVSSEKLLCLFASFMLETHQSESIMLDAKYSRVVTDTISNAGGVPLMLPTGSSQMRNLLHTKQQTSVFAGEFSGHFIFNDKRFMCHDDAVYAALRLLEYLTQSDQPLSAYVDKLDTYHGTHDVYINMPSQTAAKQLVANIKEEWHKQSQHQPSLKQHFVSNEVDGFRLDSQSSFSIIRASNTVNAVTLRLAATDQPSFDSIKQVLTNLVLAFDAQVADEINSLSITT